MRIIKGGNTTMRVTCVYCKASLEIEASDLTKESSSNPQEVTMYSYTCPCCKKKNILEIYDLNSGILSQMNL